MLDILFGKIEKKFYNDVLVKFMINPIRKIYDELLDVCSFICNTDCCYREMETEFGKDYYYFCKRCGSDYFIKYKNKQYLIRNDTVLHIYWDKFKPYILQHKTPKLVLKVFLTKLLLQKEFDEKYICDLLQEIKEQNTFMGNCPFGEKTKKFTHKDEKTGLGEYNFIDEYFLNLRFA